MALAIAGGIVVIALLLAAAINLLSLISNGEDPYVGTWVAKVNVTAIGPPTYKEATLKIRENGTWEVDIPRSALAISFGRGRRGDKWQVKKGQIFLYYGEVRGVPQAHTLKIENDKLIHRDNIFSGTTTFTKSRRRNIVQQNGGKEAGRDDPDPKPGPTPSPRDIPGPGEPDDHQEQTDRGKQLDQPEGPIPEDLLEKLRRQKVRVANASAVENAVERKDVRIIEVADTCTANQFTTEQERRLRNWVAEGGILWVNSDVLLLFGIRSERHWLDSWCHCQPAGGNISILEGVRNVRLCNLKRTAHTLEYGGVRPLLIVRRASDVSPVYGP